MKRRSSQWMSEAEKFQANMEAACGPKEVKTVAKSIGKFEIIPKSHELYEVISKLLAKFHQHLEKAVIVLVWQT